MTDVSLTYNTNHGTVRDGFIDKHRAKHGFLFSKSLTTYMTKRDLFDHEMLSDEIGTIVAEHSDEHHVIRTIQFNYGLINIIVSNGDANATVYAASPENVDDLASMIKKLQPEVKPTSNMEVPFKFWNYTPNGPQYTRRMISCINWDDVKNNYSSYGGTRTAVSRMLDPSWRPTSAGQLFIWSGAPGTGKTTALRSLAHQWRDWCDMHYITDVEKFFGHHADYMIRVLLEDSHDTASSHADDVSVEPRWKLLILEDAGEFLAPTAKMDNYSGALSRFLNVVDGLLGHGLRVLVMLTTNEEVKSLHEAVARHGRCAANVKFTPLSIEDAVEWCDEHGVVSEHQSPPRNLAELYGLTGTGMITSEEEKRTMGFANA